MRMSRRLLVVLAAAAALAACSPAQPGTDPASTIQPLYEPFVQNRNPPALLDAAPWTDELRGLLQRAQEQGRDTGEPVIDFNPLIDGQDWEIDAVAVTLQEPAADGRAVVVARFNNAGDDVEVLYDMTEAEGGWRVDNIRTENWSLREILASAGIVAETPAQ